MCVELGHSTTGEVGKDNGWREDLQTGQGWGEREVTLRSPGDDMEGGRGGEATLTLQGRL